MKLRNKRWIVLLVLILASCAFTCIQAHAGLLEDNNIFVLTPNHETASKDFISYSPASSLKDWTYFLVVFAGLQTPIKSLTIKLSSAPMLMAYTGSVTYSLIAAGYPNIFCAKFTTATSSTVASNNISATFSVNAQYGFALIGAAVLERHDVASDVDMSIRFQID